MTPEDWRRIKQVAGDAWAMPVEERDRYVREACGADDALRAEVTNLLQCMTQGDALPSAVSYQLTIFGYQLSARDNQSVARRTRRKGKKKPTAES